MGILKNKSKDEILDNLEVFIDLSTNTLEYSIPRIKQIISNCEIIQEYENIVLLSYLVGLTIVDLKQITLKELLELYKNKDVGEEQREIFYSSTQDFLRYLFKDDNIVFNSKEIAFNINNTISAYEIHNITSKYLTRNIYENNDYTRKEITDLILSIHRAMNKCFMMTCNNKLNYAKIKDLLKNKTNFRHNEDKKIYKKELINDGTRIEFKVFDNDKEIFDLSTDNALLLFSIEENIKVFNLSSTDKYINFRKKIIDLDLEVIKSSDSNVKEALIEIYQNGINKIKGSGLN